MSKDKTVTDTVDNVAKATTKIINTRDETHKFEKKDISNNRGMALLSYIGILVLIPYFGNQKSKYVKFHAKQGMNLFIIELVYTILCSLLYKITISTTCRDAFSYQSYTCSVTPWWITLPLNLIGIVIIILAIIGLINVFNNKAKKLPILNKFKIFS